MIARRPRALGFTVAECAIALAVLAGVSVLAAEMGTTSLSHRSRLEARFEAGQVAQNVLECARATPWDELTADWAKQQKLPAHVVERWRYETLAVRVEPEPDRPRVKRVTVEIRWTADGASWPAVTFTALFAARTAGGAK